MSESRMTIRNIITSLTRLTIITAVGKCREVNAKTSYWLLSSRLYR